MFLVAAIALFCVFALNVAYGKIWQTPFLTDVGEMQLLFATTIAFVVAILKREAAAKRNNDENIQGRK